MDQEDKPSREVWFKAHTEMNLPEFYKELNKAISQHNTQTIYQLSKIFTRYHFNKPEN